MYNVSDDVVSCHWYRRWQTEAYCDLGEKIGLWGCPPSTWTYTKTEVLQYYVKAFTELEYNGGAIACYVMHNYGNYYYSGVNCSKILIKALNYVNPYAN
ncbi:MAG: hypothetical protein JXB49_33325 [Bacteroidales bacterium]|nr:hypothetical protein [Bacteroidales bacterium]MBN2817452.1 hypothetical protein [Bacteroidales bacterium]